MSQQPEDDSTVIRPSTGGSTHAATVLSPHAGSADVGENGADDGLSLRIGARIGEFEITRRIGDGGFSIVYLAMDHSLERTVALKEYMPSSLASRVGVTVQARSQRHRDTFDAGLRSFVNEAKLLASFDHPALVKVHRFWEANGTAYMAMPFYQGVTVKDTVRAMADRPDEAWLRTLLAPLTEALLVIHAERCFHRDIAPDNVILLAASGKPLLLDFGAARRVIGDMTQGLTVILKSGYAPVEQYAELPGMKQGPWTDVYALAAVVYWAITGNTPPASVGRMMSDSFVPLAQCAAGRYSQEFLEAIDRALVVLPDKRTQTVEALRQELGLDRPGGGAAPILPAWDDSDATVIRPPGYRSGPTTGARTNHGGVTTIPVTAPRPITMQPLASQTIAPPTHARTLSPPSDERTAARPAREFDVRSPGPARAERADAPPTRSRAGVWIGVSMAAIAVAAGGWWAMSRSAPPANPADEVKAGAPAVEIAPAQAPSPAPAPAVALPVEPSATDTTRVVTPPPSDASPTAASTTTLPPSDAAKPVTQSPQPVEAAPPPVAARPTRKSAPAEPVARAAPRAESPKVAHPQADSGATTVECMRILQRISLGENNAQLVERLRTLKCR